MAGSEVREGQNLSKDIPEPSEGRRSVASGAAAMLAAQGTTMALAFVTSIMTARALGAAGKGEVAILLGGAAMAAAILGFGLDIANTYHTGSNRFTASESVSDSLAAVAVVSIVGVPVVYLFLRFFVPALDGVQSVVILLAACIFPFTVAAYNLKGVLVGLGRVEAAAARQVVTSLVGFVVLGVLFFTGWLDVATAVLLNLAVAVLGVAILLSLLAPDIRATGIVWPSRTRLLEQSAYARDAYVSGLTTYLDRRQDIILLGMLSTSAETGVYSVSVVFTELLWQVPRALSPALRARSLSTSEKSGEETAAASARITVVLTTILFATLVIVLYPLISFVYGSDFEQAYFVFLVLSPGAIIYGIGMVVWNHLMSQGILLPRIAIMTTGLNLLLNVVLIPRFGSMGAALASTISYSIGGGLTLWKFTSTTGMGARQILIPQRGDYALVRGSVSRLLGSARRR